MIEINKEIKELLFLGPSGSYCEAAKNQFIGFFPSKDIEQKPFSTVKSIIEYVKANYKNEFWIKENSAKFNDDYGVFKFSIEACGFQVTDKMPVSEYNKKTKHNKKR